MITFDSSWVDLFSQLSLLPDFKHRSSPRVSLPRVTLQKLRLLLALLFFVHGFWGPGPWLFCFTGSRVPSLAVSLSSRPFGTCFIQPTIHPLVLKASVVHDHCKRRCCGRPRFTESNHRILPIKFVNWSTTTRCRIHKLFALSQQKLFSSSYPEQKFGWNEILDGSIGLSPLCRSLHQSFP